jgi:cytochrome P450
MEERTPFISQPGAPGSAIAESARERAWAEFVVRKREPAVAPVVLDEERQKLVDDPRKIPNAVEELLRFEAPSPVQARRVTRDAEWYGQRVPKGSKMMLLTGSAGRDERRYPDPDRFDVDRRFERHVSLGYGIHFCLDASLARLEGRVALEETLRRFPRWEVRRDSAEMVHTSTVRGWAKLPM